MTDDKLIQQYKKLVSTYIEKGDERSLYEVSGFARACLAQDLGPEILVEMHSSVLPELVEGRDTEVRELVARANQVLLEGMMTYGLVYQELLERKSGEYKALEVYTKKIEEQAERLQEMDRLKSIFLASMSHELRTPLNSIIGFTGIILQGMSGEVNEEQRKQLTIVKNSASHLLSLINDVLDISRIEAGKVELSLSEFRLDDVVREVVEAFSSAVSEKGLELTTQVPEGITLLSDKRHIKQVLLNLVSNAVKFTDQGSVKLTARVPEDDNLEIRVSDTGIGIKQEDMEKLFQPFQQISASLTKSREGTGLGLYISQKLSVLLGGDISAKSEYGRGSEFTFTIPLRYKEG